MFKKTNEPNKPKEDRSSFGKASGNRPHIKPPEIRPRPASGRNDARTFGRPLKPVTDTAKPPSQGESRPQRIGAYSTAGAERRERPSGFRATGGRGDRSSSSSRSGAKKTTFNDRKWASSAPAGIVGQTRVKSSFADASKKDALRLVPLGGLEEIGRNCSFLEYKNEIVIVDIGLQFPEEETPGIDYIIPNMSYLEKRKENIQGIILTHGHYDHIGGLPHVLEKLGNPPIYATSITKAIVEKRQEDFPNAPKLHVITIKSGDKIKLSNYFTAFFFGVPHTIPETTGVLLETPIGNVVHFADFRVEYDDAGNPQGLDEFIAVGKMGVHTFMVDSTAAERPGHSVSEKTVERNLEEIFKNAEGRVIVATFASLLTRIGEIIKICERLGRKVAFSGYSMKTNVQIAQNLGFIKAKEGTIIPIEDAQK